MTCCICASSACSIPRASSVAPKLSRSALKTAKLLASEDKARAWHALSSRSRGSTLLRRIQLAYGVLKVKPYASSRARLAGCSSAGIGRSCLKSVTTVSSSSRTLASKSRACFCFTRQKGARGMVRYTTHLYSRLCH